ncbi:hypothetical protein DBR42_08255 [Pelomonas sp. HMWF004]|nr:hypothetical protein DBR42_08255 [Pelomonas sp. HMWF004]
MKRAPVRLLALCLAAGLLPACQPGAGKPPAAPPSAPVQQPTGAADDTAAALMAQAFAGWTDTQALTLSVPSDEAGKEVDVLVSPALVVTLDADHRVLVVTGPPDAGGGQAQQSHANGANVGAYGFERRNGRWFKTFERPSITWTGFNGEAGQFKTQPLGPGRMALSIENGSCWQGYCGHWVEVFALGADGAHPLFNERTSTSAVGATEGCTEWLAGKKLEAAADAAPITANNCFDINGQWRFVPAGDSGWPDVVLTFTGAEATQSKEDAPPVLRTIEEQLVLRHDGTAYKPLRGRNPTHDF